MPAYLPEEGSKPWCSSSRLRVERLLNLASRVQTVLDHQELVGEEMGRTRVLPGMPWPWNVWDELHGFCCHDKNTPVMYSIVWRNSCICFISKLFKLTLREVYGWL